MRLALAFLLALGAASAQKASMTELRALETRIRSTWIFHDPKTSESRFVALADSVKGEPASALLVRTQVARAQGLQRKFDDANATLDEVERELSRAGATGATAQHLRARLLIERGRVLNSSGDPGRARPLFEEAFRVADSAGVGGLAVDAAHMVAIAAGNDSALDDALAWNERALAMADSSSDPEARRWQGSLLNNLGWTYHDMKEYPKALTMFERALAEQKATGGSDDNVRIARWAIARCQRSLGRYDEALKEQEALAAEYAKAGQPDGYVFEELGELYLAKQKPAEAKPYFAKAYTELVKDPFLRYNETARLERLRELGGVAEATP